MEYKKNMPVTVKIEDIGNDGEGIGKLDGYTLFIKDAVIGDTVRAKIMKAKKNYAYAHLEEIIEASPYRTEPRCKLHRQCGGCQLQTLSYEEQLKFKQGKIRNNLIRIGGFDADYIDKIMEPIMGMEEPYRYRNKAQYPIGYGKVNGQKELVAGFYAAHSHAIIPNTDCVLGAEENKDILEAVLSYMKENNVSAYDEEAGEGVLRHVLIRKGFATGEIMVCLVIKANRSGLPAQDRLVEKLIGIKGVKSISVSINNENTNVIMGNKVHTIWGKDTIKDTLKIRDMTAEGCPYTGEELTFKISPLSFYQVNPTQTEKLYSTALEFAGLTGREAVWDLYCGIGTISLFMAKRAGKVYGVEIVPEAIEDARENARNNGIGNAEFFVGKAEEVLPDFYKNAGTSEMIHPDVIVVDPPRKGCDAACLETMLQMGPSRIVYISCDSATLARDLKILCDGGYELKRVRGCDMFGQGVHVETVVSLSLKSDSPKIEVSMKPGEDSLYEPQDKGTYEKIKAYVLEKYGFKVSSLYIAQLKDKCGLDKRLNYNLSKKDDPHVPECPKEKEDAIMDAFRHFGLIE
ncbi:MAG: 23S rRNA (uracil(1939)-C(5))-methyltransferase RlmD [Lachnospiraceae bacterium]|nr:23S rRNA (uracil(1939)-C(5))-methyltransferase RlmD [Lachnospiraceae bacterium]